MLVIGLRLDARIRLFTVDGKPAGEVLCVDIHGDRVRIGLELPDDVVAVRPGADRADMIAKHAQRRATAGGAA